MSYEYTQNGLSQVSAEKLTNDVLVQGIPYSTWASEVDTVMDFGADDGDTISVSKRQASKRSTRATVAEDESIGRRKLKFPKTQVLVTEAGFGLELTKKEEILNQGFVKSSYVEDLALEERQDANAGAFAEFADAEYTIGCATATTIDFNTDSSVPTQTVGLNKACHKLIVNKMTKQQIPTFAGGMYRAILSTDAMADMYTDVEAIAQYTQPEFRKTNSVGVYYKTELMAENEHLNNDGDVSGEFGEAIYFGKDAVLEAIASPTTTGLYVNDIADRDRVLWWYNIKGYKKTWSYATDGALLVAAGGDALGTERIVFVNKNTGS